MSRNRKRGKTMNWPEAFAIVGGFFAFGYLVRQLTR